MTARVLRRLALSASALGLLSCVAGVAAGLLAGGVPYHDGPNAGFASPPGFRRDVESLVVPLFGFGALLLATAVPMAALAWLRRRS